jgi:hypothetical protein
VRLELGQGVAQLDVVVAVEQDGDERVRGAAVRHHLLREEDRVHLVLVLDEKRLLVE